MYIIYPYQNNMTYDDRNNIKYDEFFVSQVRPDDVVHETGSAAVRQAGPVRSLSFGTRSAQQNGSGRQAETKRIRR